MVAVLNEVEAPMSLEPAESRVVLREVSWETYERLLADLEDCSAPRLTYDRGDLEIMSPTAKHEAINEALKLMLSALGEEWNVEVYGLGSTTFKRKLFKRGFEPDSCFYLKHASRIRGKDRIDLAVDPPPELVVEVEITSPAIKKLPIFAKLGVPEVWRYDGSRTTVHLLKGEVYVQQERSRALPRLTGEIITTFLNESRTLDRLTWLRKIRKWARPSKQSK
jgi:Uma2 family endonuclease